MTTKESRDNHILNIIRTLTAGQSSLSLEFLVETALTAPSARIRQHAHALAVGKRRLLDRQAQGLAIALQQ